MTVKRFELDVRMDMPKLLIDNATNRRYHLLLVNDIEEIVDILNRQEEKIRRLEYMLSKQCYCVKLDGVLNDGEQQATIEQLEKDKAILKERLRECGMRLDRFNCR